MLPSVFVVVLNWNDAEATQKCLASLAIQDYPNLHVVIVNNSPDGMLGILSSQTVSIIQNERNLGFTGGVNVGIRAALSSGAEYIWLLNSDAIAEPDALSRLVAGAEADPQVGLASPVICFADGSGAEFFGGLIRTAPLGFQRTCSQEEYERWRHEMPHCIWLVGTALLIRRRLAESIGLFDEMLFAYWEDNDYSMRSNAAGFKNIIVPESVVFHRPSPRNADYIAPPYYHYYMTRNFIFLLRKHGGLVRNFRPLLWELTTITRMVRRSREQRALARAIRAGVADGFRGRAGEYDSRCGGSAAVGTVLLAGFHLCAYLADRRRGLRIRSAAQSQLR